ncbi:MAG: DNA-binding response regulator [Cytophagales bacterium]|nr:MAG: DNA-binding response regulator [Cytophagales bacterium]
MIKIAIVDDDFQIAANLKNDLEAYHNQIELLFIANNGEDCIKLLNALNKKSMPQIILMDISMPKMNGIEATTRIHNKYPQIDIIIFSILDEQDKIVEAIQAGAKGYLDKNEQIENIVKCIEDVRNGHSQISPNIARKLIDIIQKIASPIEKPQEAKDNLEAEKYHLTRREKQILEFIKQGKSYSVIAKQLGVEYNTIKTHIRNIYDKLQVNNKVEAISNATQR